MRKIICTACGRRAVEIPPGARADSRIICSACGTVHTLSALLKELDDRRAGEGRASESAQE